MNEDAIEDLIVKVKMAVVLLEGVAEECLKLQEKNFSYQCRWALIRADMARDEGNYCVKHLEDYKEEISKSEADK